MTSVEIVRDLATVEELGATTIRSFARREGIPRSAAGRRLNALAKAGLVRQLHSGNVAVYVARGG